MKKTVIGVGLLFGLVIAFFMWPLVGNKRPPNRYLFPDGYVGLVRVKYEVPGAPKLPVENGCYLLQIPDDGLLQTSSQVQEGWAADQYYYLAAQGRRPIYSSAWGEGGMIWAGSSNGANRKFFVGTEQQWRTADNRQGPIPNGPLDPQTLLPLPTQSPLR